MTTAVSHRAVGPLLRGWRNRQRVSQLELAIQADSSARHISFIETGRTTPSMAMVLKLADCLDVPVRERNSLLLAAGYAPQFTETPIDDPAMSHLRGELDRLLTGYEPYPALILDANYTVVSANNGMLLLLDGVDESLLQPPLNAMRITLHPKGMAPKIRNLRQWRAHLLSQMDRHWSLTRSAKLRDLHEEVSGYPLPEGTGEELIDSVGGRNPLALPLCIEHHGRNLTFLSTIATFNTPMDVTVSELALETFLPADPETAAYLSRFTL